MRWQHNHWRSRHNGTYELSAGADAVALRSIGRALPRAVGAPAKSHAAGTASFFSIPYIRTEYEGSRDTIRSCRRTDITRCRATGYSCCARLGVNFDCGVRQGVENKRAYDTVSAVTADGTGFALSMAFARAGSSRAELRMNVNSDAM